MDPKFFPFFLSRFFHFLPLDQTAFSGIRPSKPDIFQGGKCRYQHMILENDIDAQFPALYRAEISRKRSSVPGQLPSVFCIHAA